MSGATRRSGGGALRVVRDRTFGPFVAAKVLSNCGTWVQSISAAVLVYELTRSALMVGVATGLQSVASLVLALPAGVLTDRVDRRKLLMLGRVISGTAVGALALLLQLRGAEGLGGPLPVFVAVTVMGIGLALSSPAMQAIVPSLVEEDDLEHALAWSSAGPSVARTVGPALGAALLLAGGPALAFAVASATHWAFAVVLVFIRPRRPQRSRSRPSALGGLWYLVRDRNAGLMMLAVAALALGSDPSVTLTPSLADSFGRGSEAVGILASAFGTGAVLGVVTFRVTRRFFSLRMAGMVGFWTLGAGLVVAGLATGLVVASIGLFVAGSGFLVGMIALNTRIQRRVPDELRGRVMALWSLAFVGSRPLGAFLNGSIADVVSVRAALVIAGLVTAATSVLASVRYRDGDSPAA